MHDIKIRMKIEIPERSESDDVETLGELFDGITINENVDNFPRSQTRGWLSNVGLDGNGDDENDNTINSGSDVKTLSKLLDGITINEGVDNFRTSETESGLSNVGLESTGKDENDNTVNSDDGYTLDSLSSAKPGNRKNVEETLKREDREKISINAVLDKINRREIETSLKAPDSLHTLDGLQLCGSKGNEDDSSHTSTDRKEEFSRKENTDDCALDGLTSLRSAKKTEVENSQDGEDKISPGQEIRKRGRGPRRNSARQVSHTAAPYSSSVPGTSQYREVPSCTQTSSNLFHAGGSVLPTLNGFGLAEPNYFHTPPPVSEQDLPDFAQLLGSNTLIQEAQGQSAVAINNDSFSEDDEITDDILCKLIDDFSTSSPDLLDDMPDLQGILDFESPNNSEPWDFEGLTSATEELNVLDPFSPISVDTGYFSSDSPYQASNADSLSPPPPTPSPQLHSVEPVAQPRRRRNKYFEGLDDKTCDKCRRAILKKANNKDTNGLNEKDERNRTLLHLAIEAKNEVYAVVLINMVQKSFVNRSGMPNTFQDLPSYLNQVDDYNRTPLLLACMYNMPRVVEYLLECGASPALNQKFLNGSILHYICERGGRFYDVAEVICARASSCLNMQNVRGESPLHIAVGYHKLKHQDATSGIQETVDNSSLIGLLLDKGARLSVQDLCDRSPLHWVIIAKRMDLLEIFYTRACDWRDAVNLKNSKGRTILHCAAQGENLDVGQQVDLINRLLVYSADTRVQDNLGAYPRDLVPGDRKAHLHILTEYFPDDMGWETAGGLPL